mmetsp:Transcript_33010/g.63067  ORF Transcript_33010/g.63067 Transcript_33010/m.63067 type:complete len:562 (-) Transcript_33010:283-1968(-)|eukprot:CAMPEP_0201668214 /NCGR_PEP_ID=MMETSP0494-20130426/18442_1 /ASSEMBLY_ACC=CAM_ASM_000839 /TAXON_ID=420259 /ORGANISM="Thalassiosira gravida, Strain GMp14c1" /LENGTH=561 /DNA_ID=CAMNT_0048148495 /DNA_START=114 /DNA_END=1799 /DNA_ORIENTATION=+
MVSWANNDSRRNNFAYDQPQSIAGHINSDVAEFSENFDDTAPPTGLDMAGHDTYLMGPKIVMLDSFVVDLLNVDTSAQTFRLKLLLNMDWEDDGTIKPETKAKRNLGRSGSSTSSLIGNSISETFQRRGSKLVSSVTNNNNNGGGGGGGGEDAYKTGTYKTGKYVLKKEFREDELGTTWNPQVVLVNAIADEDPIEAGSKFHGVQMLSGRPVVSSSVLYQPECRCEFTFSNFPFDETDLVVKFSSNKWNSEQVNFMWSNRLNSMGRDKSGRRASKFGGRSLMKRENSFLNRSVDRSAIGGVGLSEFEIIKVRVETDEKDVNSMQRYDNAEGAFSQAHLIIRVRRDPYSYLLRVAIISELLMFLEVLSFITDVDDVGDRFSISGTIFLAMVSLYGPMADALPKVSVVTRVDLWHLKNFAWLFVSNIENVLAFMFRDIINKKVMVYTEYLLGILYLYFVTKNFMWFIEPLQDREEWTSLVDLYEDKWDHYKEKCDDVLDRVLPWRWNKKVKVETKSAKIWGTAVKSAIRMKNGGKKIINGGVNNAAGGDEKSQGRSNGAKVSK